MLFGANAEKGANLYMRFLIINGANLNMLGIREPNIYGKETYDELCNKIIKKADELGVSVEIYQSNHEGALVDKIQSAYGKADGIIINAGGYTHTSVAIYDALMAVGLPAVEVHISNPDEREPFRRTNYLRAACEKTIQGRGTNGYIEALEYLAKK